MTRAPDGFPGCLLLWREVLARLQQELWLLWGGSVQCTCMEHLIEGGWESESCEGCPYGEKCGGGIKT
jgi:hypothetical protein